MKKLLFLFNLLVLFYPIQNCLGQGVKAQFLIDDTVCINEYQKIENNSANSTNYIWDFCGEDLNTSPQLSNSIELDIKKSISITSVYDSATYYSFISDKDNNSLLRIKFDSLVTNVVQVSEVNNLSGNLDKPENIVFHLENEVWYAFIINNKNGNLLRLSFKNGLKNNPDVENLGNFGVIDGPRGMDLGVMDNGNKIIAISNDNADNIVLINFGASLLNVPLIDDILVIGDGVVSRPMGIKLMQSGGNWWGLVASFGNDTVYKLDFGNNLFSTPVLTSVAEVNFPTEVAWVEEGGHYFGFITGRNSGLFKLDFEGDLSTTSPVLQSFGTYNGALKNVFGFTILRTSPAWAVLTVNSGNNILNIFSVTGSCPYALPSLSKKERPQISFSAPGTYPISLTAYDEFGNRDDTTQFITVTDSIAPTLNIIPKNVCFGSESELVLVSDQTITNSNWIINGASISADTAVYNFPSPGEYPITLQAQATNGCSQRITKPITIYDPPEPDFLVTSSGALCSNGTVNFTNQTNTQGADSLITYNWNFSGEDSSSITSPEYLFATGGNKTVTLTAAIPGCEASADTTFAVFEGPAVEFVFENECAGEGVQFLNQTTGSNITQYNWDFGDGNTFASTTLSSPEHVFDSVGNYDVSLTVNDAQGCENTVTQTFNSFAKPEAAFTAELSCAGTPTRFTDETQIDASANVVLWNWDFGDAAANATTKNPEYTFASPGSYNVQLIAETNEGCADSAMQQIVVETPVQPGFEAIKICPSDGLDVQLNDTSLVSGGENISQWLWQVGDELYQIQNPVHTFTEPGEYSVSLTATASSLCNASVTRTIEVLPLPEAGFSFTQACANDAVSFTNLSAHTEYIHNYQWDFGGEGTATTANPSFAFAEAGTYPVQLLIEDIHGCTDTLTQSIEILPQPKAGYTVEKTTGAAPFTVSFENTSEDATQYQWDFAGLDTSTVFAPDFTFEETGTYPVQLSVANAIGCADTLERIFTVVQPVFDVSLNNLTVQETTSGNS